ncbi:uncharacterized protein LY89DRAFT_600233 [Mollisia scopiformis]|uniref:Endoplasmic reticulum junction formation protein lunapark n=1 Tax=Mollisia scopiformis TaxID=149040 RepID=A0A132B7E9_MOLSC|nr:uncharacterized protein LY89DRAFT_600233 [Mollisia scopiformis]KUJ08173.1 hypothetical protein LY89DRAFT_600233 [Mollisia scopiformis]
MVSLWPWKGEDNSPAGFEKTLSALASKITASQAHLDSLRSRGRRFKALWTLYTSLAYLISVVVLFLAVGWKNLGALEYTALASSPVVIYLVRAGITAYYDYRTDSITTRLEEQQAERTKTIEKLKAATKYDSTQVLLEKYGGAAPKAKKPATPKAPKAVPKQTGRVSIGAPPPTANIGRPEHIPSQPSTPQPIMRPPPPQIMPPPASSPATEFAPNAYSAPPQYAQSGDNAGGNWYDRILDLLMGEDETSPKNRVALICQDCRLVNGQAPPGTRTLAELGKWRCFGCGSMNGEEDEAAKVVKEMKERMDSQEEPASPEIVKVEHDSGKEASTDESGEMVEAADSGEDTVEVKPRRGRPRGNK